jgi:uncharacterized SAM-binding protein YcdF (DUF218 family)
MSRVLQSIVDTVSGGAQVLMKQRDAALLVLGGWPCRDSQGVWRSSLFAGGGMGDRLRVEAAALLYRMSPRLVVVSGGKGKLAHLPEVPACASVLRRELLELGIPADDIFEEAHAANTYEQLQSIKSLLAHFPISTLRILSNRYHLPRIEAFLDDDSELRAWKASGRIQPAGAEDILLQMRRIPLALFDRGGV